MILANLRERLVPSDVDMVVRLLARGSDRDTRTLTSVAEERGIDALLDHRDLPGLLLAAPDLGVPSAALFIYVSVRHALKSAGVDDVRLSDYLGAMILEFGLRDRAARIAHHDDEVYRYVTDLVADIETADARRAFLIRAHLGNFSLWLAGIFPDYIAARRDRTGGPGLRFYEAMGARGFRLASDHRLARQHDLADVYALAADSFTTLRLVLNRLSRRLLFPRRPRRPPRG
jgi:hypothetical protein